MMKFFLIFMSLLVTKVSFADKVFYEAICNISEVEKNSFEIIEGTKTSLVLNDLDTKGTIIYLNKLSTNSIKIQFYSIDRIKEKKSYKSYEKHWERVTSIFTVFQDEKELFTGTIKLYMEEEAEYTTTRFFAPISEKTKFAMYCRLKATKGLSKKY